MTFERTIPTLRIFSVEKALDFYVGFLGFKVDWEHRFYPNAPVYMQVSRDGLELHLSEHHGDGTPGTHVMVLMKGIDDYCAEIAAKPYPYYNPQVEERFWGAKGMKVIDPFNNHIEFSEPHAQPA
jgi:catechol 2,3-dioxygenase-like lactoylglutathione lyase family enzyme